MGQLRLAGPVRGIAQNPPDHAFAQPVGLDLQGHARAISELQPAYKSGLEHTDPLEYIEVLRDAGAINERFGELQASVKREILVFTKPPYATQPQENPEGLEVSRHVRARSVYESIVARMRDPGLVEMMGGTIGVESIEP